MLVAAPEEDALHGPMDFEWYALRRHFGDYDLRCKVASDKKLLNLYEVVDLEVSPWRLLKNCPFRHHAHVSVI